MKLVLEFKEEIKKMNKISVWFLIAGIILTGVSYITAIVLYIIGGQKDYDALKLLAAQFGQVAPYMFIISVIMCFIADLAARDRDNKD